MFVFVGAGSLAAAHSPAFLWSGRPNMGMSGSDYLHEVSGVHLQQTVAGLARATSSLPLLSTPAQAPEVQVVFLYDELSTDDVRSLGNSAFPKLQKLMADSPSSLSVPFTTRTSPLHFEGATNVPVASASEFLTNFPKLANNGKTDTMLIQLPTNVQSDKRDGYAELDEVVGRVTAAVAKATDGNYAALLTGATGSASDIEHITMRRRLATSESEVGLHITPELMAALLVSFLLILVFLNGFCCLFSLQTPKKFEEPKQA